MNITMVKTDLKKHIGKSVRVREYIGRNKYENYEAKFIEMYPNLFVIDKAGELKTFSYSDALVKNVIIKEK